MLVKLFGYELRRLLWNKLFLGLLAVTLCCGWFIFTGETILGAACTAPFSPWSFGLYLSRLAPLAALGELFFLSQYTSPKERRVSAVTRAAPIKPGKYDAVRCGAVLVGTLLLCFCGAGLCMAFYVLLFGWYDFLSLLAPAVLVWGPVILFCLGAGLTLGAVHPALPYVLTGAAFLARQLSPVLDLALGGFFSEYPAALGGLAPDFSVPAQALLGRTLYAGIGLGLLLFRRRNRS